MTTEHTWAQRLSAEFLGTFVLVLGGCGAAVLSSGIADVGIGFLGVSFAFGLAVLIMAYAVGHVSGGHFNPAVTVGLATARRFPWSDVLAYVVVQVVAAVAAEPSASSSPTAPRASTPRRPGSPATGSATAPGGYSLVAVLVAEVVLTAIFLYVILGATDTRAPKGFAPWPSVSHWC